ncbi:MAG: hypothetical protein LBV67_03230 [Streptococcaceae bacterium]|jgi:hypothetical protein|nr:hypothetical protein [Streptococcaceae bacterium]
MELKIGGMYDCAAVGLSEQITGRIVGIHEHTVVMEVLEYNQQDAAELFDKQSRVIVRKRDIISEI